MLKKKLFTKKHKIIISIFILLFLSTFLVNFVNDGNNQDFNETLRIHFIDVGQGDAVLIQNLKDNKNMLIDGGDRWNRVADKLVSYLQDQDVKTVNTIVSTHPHADHIGGLPAVINNFDVEMIYDSGRVHTTKTYENYLNLIDKKNIPFQTPRRGEEIELGNLVFEVRHPADEVSDYSLNNASIVMRLEYHDVSFIFTGDIEYEAEMEILETDQSLAADVLKVSHHGSRTSTDEAFLQEVNPDIAVIQVGEDNRYGHPHNEILDRLEEYEIEIYRNDIHGDIVVSTDGKKILSQVQNEGDPRAPPEDDKEKININTADSDELQELWGVGTATAENIIEYRNEYGVFSYFEEIKEVRGIGDSTFENIKNDIILFEIEEIQETERKVNINKAAEDQLKKLLNLKPEIAESLIEFREKNGPYQKLEEILKIEAIDENEFEKLKNEISL